MTKAAGGSSKRKTSSQKKAAVSKTKRPPAKKRPAPVKTRETQDARRRRAERILHALRETYPSADCALNHRSAYQLLVATILSAQCTDERVNIVTPSVFNRYPDAKVLADADQGELEVLIRSTGFFRNKAKNLIAMAQTVRDSFAGEIPDDMESLLTLAGVARKTANCVLGTWFGHNVGVVVDTHVGRLALRLGLLSTARDDKDAVRIEQDLMALFPTESWTYLSHALIDHGRAVCSARKPKCDACPLAEDCPSAGKIG